MNKLSGQIRVASEFSDPEFELVIMAFLAPNQHPKLLIRPARPLSTYVMQTVRDLKGCAALDESGAVSERTAAPV